MTLNFEQSASTQLRQVRMGPGGRVPWSLYDKNSSQTRWLSPEFMFLSKIPSNASGHLDFADIHP